MSKGKKKRVNPTRIPVSKADVERAKDAATFQAIDRLMYLFTFILLDKHDAPGDEVQQLVDEIDYYADSINEGRLTWKDVEHAVKEEYKIKIRFLGGKGLGRVPQNRHPI